MRLPEVQCNDRNGCCVTNHSFYSLCDCSFDFLLFNARPIISNEFRCSLGLTSTVKRDVNPSCPSSANTSAPIWRRVLSQLPDRSLSPINPKAKNIKQQPPPHRRPPHNRFETCQFMQIAGSINHQFIKRKHTMTNPIWFLRVSFDSLNRTKKKTNFPNKLPTFAKSAV